jgi:hypothetical protein
VDREEFMNVGVILFCLERRFLEARIDIDAERLRALCPDIDMELLREHLEAFPKIARGDRDAGPIGLLSQRERFHWLVAPRSTIIQVSPVHSGLCEDPEIAIERLFDRLVKP